MAIGKIVGGLTNIVGASIGGRARRREEKAAQGEFNSMKQRYAELDTSNPYQDMSNPYEDLTVNTQAADFAAQQQAQGLSNIMGSMNQAAGGSGIAALAQSLANQQSQNAQQASVSIGQQEQRNQMAAAQQAGALQSMERMGAEQSRSLKAQLLGEEFQIDANELAASEEAIQAARAARTEAVGQFAGGVGDAAGTALTGYSGDNGLLTSLQAGQAAQQRRRGTNG